ncbi:NLRC3 [Symbiodinium natans]|uniref:NLRC3 protein n=1 Tax=Symbiodinium natans TaxID=878477 RepID=A0A812MAP0_9DINO|nr:NLRC3 [Symbiodinium natans]
MNSSNATESHVDDVLQMVGIDRRAQEHLPVLAGIAGSTLVLGTAILQIATWRSFRRTPPERARLEPDPVGATTTGAGISDGHLTMPSTQQSAPSPVPVSSQRRFRQVLAVFSCTVGLCMGVTVAGIADSTLSKETGLLWESYVLLLSAACLWMLAQASVAAFVLESGRGYPPTAFAEAMFSGVCPFVSDSFDTLKDVLFGGLCLQSTKVGLHVVGWLSWVYLIIFHLCLMCSDRFVADLAASHLSVFSIATIGTSSPKSKLSWSEKLKVLIAKQLTPTKRWMLLVENVPQAGLAVIYLAVEGGSVLVGLLNLGVPAAQVLVSFFMFPRLQRGLAKSYAQRLDSAITDGDRTLAHKLGCERYFFSVAEAKLFYRLGFELHFDNEDLDWNIANESRLLEPLIDARFTQLSDNGHVLVEGDVDPLALSICRQCLMSAMLVADADGIHNTNVLRWYSEDLRGQGGLLAAGLNFASQVLWIDQLDIIDCELEAEDAAALFRNLASAKLRHLSLRGPDPENRGSARLGQAGAKALAHALPDTSHSLEALVLNFLHIGDAEAVILAGALPSSHITYLNLSFNDIEDAGALALAGGLQQNETLQRLFIGRNKLEHRGEGLSALRDACEKRQPPVRLDC